MDYLRVKQKARLKRFIVILFALILSLGGLLVFSNFNHEHIEVLETKLVENTQSATEDWKTIIENLDQIRARAIMHRDKSLLYSVYVKESQLDLNDFELIDNLLESNSSIFGLEFKVEKVRKISHRWSNSEEVVELEVTDSRNQYVLQRDMQNLTIPSRKSRTWLISINRIGENWLISNAELVSNDR